MDAVVPKDPIAPAALVLRATVARRYYLDGASKSDIAAEFQLSRFKIARLLEQARSSGLVRIELDYRGDINLDLSARLRAAYKLNYSVVINCAERDDASLRDDLGRAAAGLLTEVVDGEDVLGLAWARSLMAMRTSVNGLAACPVVQLTGALPRSDVDASCIELVRDVARASGGHAYFFYAPMIVRDAATAQALRTQPEIARAFALFPSVTKAVVGVGAWQKGESTVADALTDAECDSMRKRGVQAEVGGIQLDDDGRVVTTQLTDRLVGIDAGQLRAIPDVIALAYGTSKARAVRAAVHGGFITSMVTHASLARKLLELS